MAAKTNVQPEVILRSFMLERLLERLSLSDYRQNIILKGGLLIASMVGIRTRSTMDMDATVKGRTMTSAEISSIIENILKVPVDDGVQMTFRGIEDIREEADYPGFRVSIEAILDKTKQILKVDITTGDSVTPREIEYNYPLMFEDRSISVMAYNLETVLAEKFETIIVRGITNTRMRDFYDIYILNTTRTIDYSIFNNALERTVEKRDSTKQMSNIAGVIDVLRKSTAMEKLWDRYQARSSYAKDITWDTVLDSVKLLSKNLKMKDEG
jgi:predicted nucleotidyltransferase component of viral defense system